MHHWADAVDSIKFIAPSDGFALPQIDLSRCFNCFDRVARGRDDNIGGMGAVTKVGRVRRGAGGGSGGAGSRIIMMWKGQVDQEREGMEREREVCRVGHR